MGRGARQGTELTAGPPAPAAPAAALGPRDGLTAAGWSLAHGLQHLGEAGPLPDVCGKRAGVEGGRTVPSRGPFPGASGSPEGLARIPDVSDMLWVARGETLQTTVSRPH